LFNSQSAVPVILGSVAIVSGVVYASVRAVLHHKERIAKIENGIDPDQPDLKVTQPWKG
jgi:hypothetical protein